MSFIINKKTFCVLVFGLVKLSFVSSMSWCLDSKSTGAERLEGVSPVSPYNSHVVVTAVPFYRWGIRGSERWSDLSWQSQGWWGADGIQTKICLNGARALDPQFRGRNFLFFFKHLYIEGNVINEIGKCETISVLRQKNQFKGTAHVQIVVQKPFSMEAASSLGFCWSLHSSVGLKSKLVAPVSVWLSRWICWLLGPRWGQVQHTTLARKEFQCLWGSTDLSSSYILLSTAQNALSRSWSAKINLLCHIGPSLMK